MSETTATRLDESLRRLAVANRELSEASDASCIAATACGAARAVADADGAAFVSMQADRCACLHEVAAEPVLLAQPMDPASCCAKALMLGQTILSRDVRDDASLPQELFRHTFVRGVAMAPVVVSGQTVGALVLYWMEPHTTSQQELRLLQLLVDSTSVAMQRVFVRSELSDSEERYRSLVENLEDVVLALDGRGRVTYASPSVSRYGYAPSEVIGQPFLHFVHLDDILELVDAMSLALGGRVQTRVFRVLAKDGTEHYVRTAGRTSVRNGMVVGINLVMIDVTELRRTEHQLQMAQRMDAVGRLAGGIAHDFNNLLSVVLSYAGFVADEVQHLKAVHADVEEIRKAGTRAATLTRQLLAFSGKQVLAPQSLDLNRLALDLERMLRRVVGEDIELLHELDRDLGTVKADPAQLEQVIMNLVVNARDSMPRGGTLTITTRNVDATQHGQEAEVPPGRWVALIVSDTGGGMDEQTKERLFEPFFTTKEVGKGTGLGLSIVYGIVTQSGGNVRVASALGAGTTFTILLPRSDGVATVAHARAASLRPPVGTETVLLVEDDPAVRALTARILRSAGYTTLVAAGSTEAIALCDAAQGRIDVLVTDVVMPRLDGRELASHLKRRCAGLPVLYMSGYSNVTLGEEELGPRNNFIAKPFSDAELRRKVRDVLDEERAPRILLIEGDST